MLSDLQRDNLPGPATALCAGQVPVGGSAMMMPGQAILLGFRRAFDLRGRSSRAEYLPFLAFAMALLAGMTLLGAAFDRGWAAVGLGVIALYVPVTSAGVRRLHDAGEPGHLMLVPLAPGLGALILASLLGLIPALVPGLNVALVLFIMFGGAVLVKALGVLALIATVLATVIAFVDVMGRLLLPSDAGPNSNYTPPAARRRRPGSGMAGRVMIAALALAPLPALAQSGSVEPCLAAHGNRDLYRADLALVGWTDLPQDQRAAGLAMLADVYLPVTAPGDGTWAGLMAGRAGARAFWDDLAGTRTLMTRDGAVLLLAGFRDDNGDVRVECWAAGPRSEVTDSFFQMIGQVWQTEGVQMTQVNLPATSDRPTTEVFVSRLTPPVAVDPPLAATDGLRTRITIPEAIP